MDCGCEVIEIEYVKDHPTHCIDYCPKHRAADAMLEALHDFLGCMAQWGDWDDGCFYYSRTSCPELQKPIRKAEAAIASAEPKDGD